MWLITPQATSGINHGLLHWAPEGSSYVLGHTLSLQKKRVCTNFLVLMSFSTEAIVSNDDSSQM